MIKTPNSVTNFNTTSAPNLDLNIANFDFRVAPSFNF